MRFRVPSLILKVVAIGLLMFATSAPSPAVVTPEGAIRNARAMAQTMIREGYTLRDTFQTGFLPEGDFHTLRTTLYAGVPYTFIAGGCEDAYDIDLYLYDENENLIDQDRRVSEYAGVTVTPAWTGTFYVVVKMYRSTPAGAHWALQTGYQS